jgi:hypothetical protein
LNIVYVMLMEGMDEEARGEFLLALYRTPTEWEEYTAEKRKRELSVLREVGELG